MPRQSRKGKSLANEKSSTKCKSVGRREAKDDDQCRGKLLGSFSDLLGRYDHSTSFSTNKPPKICSYSSHLSPILTMLVALLSVASLAALLVPGPFRCFPYLLLFVLPSMVLWCRLARNLLMWVRHKLVSMLVAVCRSCCLHGGRALPSLPVTVMDACFAPELGIAWGLGRLDTAADVPRDAHN